MVMVAEKRETLIKSWQLMLFSWLWFLAACATGTQSKPATPDHEGDTLVATDLPEAAETAPANSTSTVPTDLGPIDPDSLVAFARTLQGTPYLYASTDPTVGFDCSGFITYVFNHFGKTVPRSSIDFTNYGRTIPVEEAMPGDLILFTGTDSLIREVGHMGIIEHRDRDSLYFIHSSSGKNNIGVVITSLGKYYRTRFVKTIRVLPDSVFTRYNTIYR